MVNLHIFLWEINLGILSVCRKIVVVWYGTVSNTTDSEQILEIHENNVSK